MEQQNPLYAFARLVAGDDRAESWLAQEKERRLHLRPNVSSADLNGHPFLHNQKSWAENCSVLHDKVMELYRGVGCWTKHPWNKDNCDENSYATIPFPFNIPFADRPAHDSHVHGPAKLQPTCLTCIHSKRGCLSGPVVNGRCLVCQGGHAMTNEAIRRGDIRHEDAYDENNQPKRQKVGGQFSGGKQRTCYWTMPEYFINTYEVAHLFFGGRFRANNKVASTPKVVLKLAPPNPDSASQLQTDQPTTPSMHSLDSTHDQAMSAVSDTPGIPEPESRFTDSSTPSSVVVQSSSPGHVFSSSVTSINQHSYLVYTQPPPFNHNQWSSNGFPVFNMTDEPIQMSDEALLFPPSVPFTPSVTYKGHHVETIDPNLLHADIPVQSTTMEAPNFDEQVIDPALLDAETSPQLTEE